MNLSTRPTAFFRALTTRSRCLLSAMVIALLASSETLGADDNHLFFEKHVRPLLIKRCYECHSTQAKKLKGSLSLEDRRSWQKGGDRGPAIEPGKPDASLLIQAIKYNDPDFLMPPSGKMSDAEIAVLTKWVAMGASDPRDAIAATPVRSTIDIEKGKTFWSFRPPVTPKLPDVKDHTWAQTPIDRFVLAGLENQGLHPVAKADRRTLIRRATLDLTGLPPTAEEVEAFVNDPSTMAYARLIDRLLASPRYGERWGRHWLDVARYADSNGLDENVAYGNAWRYRDYVIQAFNRDLPFDQFIQEQLAGDLLPRSYSAEENNARIIATGFLALGPKVLAEVDETKMQMDIVDEQVDVVSKAFMGLTIGCARCHDHKFDPIATTDYYGLAGVFRSTKTMESFKKVAKWSEIPLDDPKKAEIVANHDAAVKSLKAEIETAEKAAKADPKKVQDAAFKAAIQALRTSLATLEKTGPATASAMAVSEGTVENTRVHIRGNHLTLGSDVSRRVPLVLAGSKPPTINHKQSGRLELARWLSDPCHPLTSRVIVNRIWRWHFGRGIVASTDNFGALGERPTHPELLDWLAIHFIEQGWSIKQLHRLIMLSSTYQSSATYDAKSVAIDPDNRLLWRFSPRRLEAEAIRDALLCVAGSLDTTIGGSLLTVKNRDYFFDHTSKDLTKYDTNRRSVYLPVVRNHMYDVFDLFDYSDSGVSFGSRDATTVAPQALFVMNSELVEQSAANLSGRLIANKSLSEKERINRLYLIALGRQASQTETVRAKAYLAKFDQNLLTTIASPELRLAKVWQALSHVILSSNEFIYIP